MNLRKSGIVSERKWVVNASPVILLGKVGHLGLLEALCTQLIIPFAVMSEVCAEPYRDAAQDWLRNQVRAHVHDVGPIDSLITTWDLGIGESQVLTWAREHPGYEAILDDRAARNCAIALGIPVRGTLGVSLLAKREGLLSHVQPVFARLREAGLRIAPAVLDTALELAGEKES
jgi:predicted nucleic acid-binding protein